jgi:hypothetical protein
MRAEELAQELEKIESADGQLTPAGVVQKAKNPKHPLHGEFEWDNSKAGYQYRLQQARVLIQRARVVVEREEKVIKVATYVRDPSVDKNLQGYKRITTIGEEDKYEAMLHELNRAETYLKRAYDIGNALGYGSEIKSLLDALVDTTTRARPSGKGGDEDRVSA